MTANTFPAPAGAVHVDDWDCFAGFPLRGFTGSTWVVDRITTAPTWPAGDRIEVAIVGDQRSDGSADRWVCVNRLVGYDDRLTAEQARRLSGVLSAAADEI